jgi:hypothetical protein
LVYVNLFEAIQGVSSHLIPERFFDMREAGQYLEAMASVAPIMWTSHEVGHATGSTIVPNPEQLFGVPYNIMEEARGELFAMWILQFMERHGTIPEGWKVAGYYTMLERMISNQRFPPKEHSGARNLMFNYFLDKGAIRPSRVNGHTRFFVDESAMDIEVPRLLAILTDIKAVGDTGQLERVMEAYISMRRSPWIKRKLIDMPLGDAIIYPELEQAGGRFTGGLVYPAHYEDQRFTIARMGG